MAISFANYQMILKETEHALCEQLYSDFHVIVYQYVCMYFPYADVYFFLVLYGKWRWEEIKTCIFESAL